MVTQYFLHALSLIKDEEQNSQVWADVFTHVYIKNLGREKDGEYFKGVFCTFGPVGGVEI